MLLTFKYIYWDADGLPPLTQRQERRAHQSTITTHGTIDSWDFSLTASPTTSIPTRPGYFRGTSFASVRKSADSSSLTAGPEAVFEFEAEVDATVDSVDVVKEDDEEQMELFASGPLVPPEISPSHSLSSSSVSSPSGAATSAGTSAPDAGHIPTGDATKSTSLGPISLPVPVPRHVDPHSDIETQKRPNSIPGASIFSSLSTQTSAPLPSTSAPSNLAQASSSSSIWRKLKGSGSGNPKAEDPTRAKKGFLSRKASDALVRTRSKTACMCPFSTSISVPDSKQLSCNTP